MSEHEGWTENQIGSKSWRAHCSCCWSSNGFESEAAAMAALIEHYSTESAK